MFADGKKKHVHEIQIYYEDTDFTGVVYHGNYLKFFERARDHLVGIEKLKAAYDDGIAVHVHKVHELTMKGAAKHGDVIVVETVAEKESPFRLRFDQRIFVKSKPEQIIVTGRTDTVFINTQTQQLTQGPQSILSAVA